MTDETIDGLARAGRRAPKEPRPAAVDEAPAADDAPAAPIDALTGRTLDDRYLLQDRLGAGGMGAVYLAEQRSMDRTVAVKVIAPRLTTDTTVTRRFMREARLAGRIGHPHVVSVFECGRTHEGLHYLVMEHIRGRTLAELLALEGPLEPHRAMRIAMQLCDALTAAHDLDIVHRDLKPANIMLVDTADGADMVKVLDFGLARSLSGDDSTLTQSGAMFGTPTYMPPEVARGEGCDARGDLYALGTILYEMVVGAPPFSAENPLAVAMHHAYQAPPAIPDTVPPVLARLVDQLLEKEPARRPPTSANVRARLGAAADALRTGRPPAVSAPPSEPSLLPIPRPKGPFIALAVVLIAAVAAALFGLGGGTPAAIDAAAAAPVDAAIVIDRQAPDARALDAGPADARPRDAAPASPDAAPVTRAPRRTRPRRPATTTPRAPATRAPSTLPGSFIRPK